MPTRQRGAADIAYVRQHHGVAILQQARLVAIGGIAWNVYRGFGGDGVNSPAGTRGQPVSHTLEEAYVWGAEEERNATAAPGTQVGDVTWTLVAPLGVDLAPEDVIESQQNSRLRFTVKTVPPMAEHVQAELEPRVR